MANNFENFLLMSRPVDGYGWTIKTAARFELDIDEGLAARILSDGKNVYAEYKKLNTVYRVIRKNDLYKYNLTVES